MICKTLIFFNNMVANINSVVNFLNGMVRNTFGVVVTTSTEPRMNKTGNPYFGRVRKVSVITNVALGRDYQNAVNARLEREGLAADFKAEKPNGKHHFGEGGYLLQSDKDETKFYLRLTENKNTTRKVVWLLDGREATDDEVAAIKAFIPLYGGSAKQAAFGLNEEVKVTDVLLENVTEIRQGNKVLK